MIAILGGGTFEPIRNHLSLSAPAFGTTARMISKYIESFYNLPQKLYLTKMADSNSFFVTNKDVEDLIDVLLEDKNTKCIVLNVAFCDFRALDIDDIKCGSHAERLITKNGNIDITLTPTDKIIKKIRIKRPDIFLVGFKTTTNKTSEEQFKIGLQFMKSNKCNLLFANDTVTRNNFIITAEESIYGESTNRHTALVELCEIIKLRYDLTYNHSIFNDVDSTNINTTPESFQKVIKFLIENGGFIENNGNGFTPGHFCYKLNANSFLSSQRKANHNKVFDEGMSIVSVSHKYNDLSSIDYLNENDEIFTVSGKRKASVGARSQWLILKQNPGYDCIIHTHNPRKENSLIPIASQREFQCGSLECGLNTVNHMAEYSGKYGNIKAVYLDKHGANILFSSDTDPNKVIDFIKDNLELGVKTK